ncbi:MAG TPA: hypothetical protein VKV37_16655 [Ktedonobacteraceae bacterium]|nr:hypothetical protein [Ktedonobacteraceae bacterium]
MGSEWGRRENGERAGRRDNGERAGRRVNGERAGKEGATVGVNLAPGPVILSASEPQP